MVATHAGIAGSFDCPVLRQAIDSINAFFAREKQSQKIAAEFDLKYKSLLSMPEATAPATELETLTHDQLRHDVTAKLGPPQGIVRG